MLRWVPLLPLMNAALWLSLHLDGPVTSDGCNRARTRTFSATDGCGNTATAARIVRWIVNLVSPQINTQVLRRQLLDVIHLQVISMLLWVLLLQLMHAPA